MLPDTLEQHLIDMGVISMDREHKTKQEKAKKVEDDMTIKNTRETIKGEVQI